MAVYIAHGAGYVRTWEGQAEEAEESVASHVLPVHIFWLLRCL
jgi:hypothetical protein